MEDWTKQEEKILKDYYPTLGMKVQMFLPNRTPNAIDHKVRNMNIKFGLLQEGKAGYLDIETSGLKADFAIMYTFYIKTAGEDEYISSKITQSEILDGTLDKRVVQELMDGIMKYKRIYTYYGTMFDIPFARSRALAHGIEFLPYGLVEHKDVYYLAKRVLCIHSKRLESVCALLGIPGKTHLDAKTWIAANAGKKEAVDYIATHNKLDVEILEKAHKALMKYEKGSRRFM